MQQCNNGTLHVSIKYLIAKFFIASIFVHNRNKQLVATLHCCNEDYGWFCSFSVDLPELKPDLICFAELDNGSQEDFLRTVIHYPTVVAAENIKKISIHNRNHKICSNMSRTWPVYCFIGGN